jgi:hypothetical protein
MILSVFQNPFYPAQAVGNLQSQLTTLQTELGTGEVSQNYAGIGNDRALAVSLQSQLSLMSNYSDVSNTVGVRLTAAQQALGAVSSAADLVHNAALNSQFTLNQNGQTNDQTNATGQLGQILDALNADVGGVYLFSGAGAANPAVASVGAILDGSGAQAGLKQIIAERAQADLGSNGLGRLVIPPPSASHAIIILSCATLAPHAIASVAGTQDISALSSSGGTLVVNGTPVAIAPGGNAAAILSDINGNTATTGVSATLRSEQSAERECRHRSRHRRRHFSLGLGRAWPVGWNDQPGERCHPGCGDEQSEPCRDRRGQSAADRYLRDRPGTGRNPCRGEDCACRTCGRDREP